MRQFIYRPEQADLTEWPSGELRLTCAETQDPREADVFVYPGALHGVTAQQFRRLPYLAGNEARHVAFHCSDEETLYGLPCMFIRCNTRPWYFNSDPNTVSWPWPVEDFSECALMPAGGFKYDVSFHGWLSTNARRYSSDACKADQRLTCDVRQYPDFCGYIFYEDEGIRRRQEFRRSMKESRIALCPESIPGVLPYRFFEAMSAARIPLLVSSDYVLPFAEQIPYRDFIIECPAHDASRAADYAFEYLNRWSEADIIAKGAMARRYWEDWLDREDWPRLMTYAVEKQVKVLV